MVNYRRNKIAGGTYFFTVTLQNRKSNVLTKHIDLLRVAMKQVQMNHYYKMHAIVILPNHLHAIWELPDDDNDYSMRCRQIKTLFTNSLINSGVILERKLSGGYDLWQKRFWEHTIRNEYDFETHVNYIHYNPVKHKLVQNINDWPYSSFHSYVKKGLLPSNWSCDEKMIARIDKSNIRE